MDEMGVTPGSLSVSKLLVYLLCFLKVASAFALYLHLGQPGSYTVQCMRIHANMHTQVKQSCGTHSCHVTLFLFFLSPLLSPISLFFGVMLIEGC